MFFKVWLTFLVFITSGVQVFPWGFFAHKKISEHVVYSLPPKMLVFYKEHMSFMKEQAVQADKRRYVVKGEAQRHYIDMEYYADHAPCSWHEVCGFYKDQELAENGILPWNINKMVSRLTRAFVRGDKAAILMISVNLIHYDADACVPLHTTKNYDGQDTGQRGIHGLWESRLPELFSSEYDFFVGKARYIDDVEVMVWSLVEESHSLVGRVLAIEKSVSRSFPSFKKYCFEKRGGSIRKMHSRSYAKAYHDALEGMVEERMRKSILTGASLLYTAWKNAGSPNLSVLCGQDVSFKNLRKKGFDGKVLRGVRVCEE